MAKDPAVLFYTSDFISGTMTFTDDQVGKYIRLLCIQHQTGPIPNNHMVSVLGEFSEGGGSPVWSKFKKDQNGYWYNDRMLQEAEKRRTYIESRKVSGKLGGRPKKNHTDNHTDNRMHNRMHNHMGNRMENDNTLSICLDKRSAEERRNVELGRLNFKKFWDKYPSKVNKVESENWWINNRPDDETVDDILAALSWQTKQKRWTDGNGSFVPNPNNWLENKRWLDEKPAIKRSQFICNSAAGYTGAS